MDFLYFSPNKKLDVFVPPFVRLQLSCCSVLVKIVDILNYCCWHYSETWPTMFERDTLVYVGPQIILDFFPRNLTKSDPFPFSLWYTVFLVFHWGLHFLDHVPHIEQVNMLTLVRGGSRDRGNRYEVKGISSWDKSLHVDHFRSVLSLPLQPPQICNVAPGAHVLYYRNIQKTIV